MSFKLFYNNLRGKTEIIQVIFAVAGKTCEQVRLTPEQWEDFKKDKARGTASLPILQAPTGEYIPEIPVIIMYLGRELGLYGQDNGEMTKVDLAMELIRQLSEKGKNYMLEADQTKKAELKTTFQSGVVIGLSVLEGMLKLRNNGEGYILGDNISLADISIFYWFLNFLPILPEGLDKYPKLKGLEERLRAQSGIAEWLNKRPTE